jgi:hypothetical protein
MLAGIGTMLMFFFPYNILIFFVLMNITQLLGAPAETVVLSILLPLFCWVISISNFVQEAR